MDEQLDLQKQEPWDHPFNPVPAELPSRWAKQKHVLKISRMRGKSESNANLSKEFKGSAAKRLSCLAQNINLS